MYHLEIKKQMTNTRSVRTLTLTEWHVGSKSWLRLSQLQDNNEVNNQSTPGESTKTSGNKHQPPLSHASKGMNLV
jgi:hypothetical protein